MNPLTQLPPDDPPEETEDGYKIAVTWRVRAGWQFAITKPDGSVYNSSGFFDNKEFCRKVAGGMTERFQNIAARLAAEEAPEPTE